MKTLDIQYRQAQSVNIDLGMLDIALFEVEHSTPIYSGLLRLNDIHLLSPYSKATYSIVSNDDRRNLFVRQLNRPTFTMSTLRENCTFLLYPNVFTWHKRIVQGRQMEL